MSPRRPLILVATSYGYNQYKTARMAHVLADYVTSVTRAGGVPLLVPPMPDGPAWRQLAAMGQGLLIIGGPDLDPAAYGQERHPKTVLSLPERIEADTRLLARADRRRLPVLGICLGCQALVVHRGGTLFQHIPQALPEALKHHRHPRQPRLRHPVSIDPSSRLAEIVGPRALSVNTSHHQAVDVPGRHLRPVAHAPDGVIEAVEDPRPGRFCLGVQWHPEELYREARHLALFEALVRESQKHKE